MLLKDFLPRPEIQEFVRLYRIVHFSFDRSAPTPIKAYPPRPEQCLAFYPYDTERAQYAISGKEMNHFRASLTGQQVEVFNRQVGNNFLALQIVFQPTGLYRLTGIPGYELTNQYLDAELIFSPEVRLVNEQLFHAKGYNQMLEIAHNFICSLLSKRVKDAHPLDDVSKLMLRQNKQAAPLDWLAHESCLGYKQFERKFKERTGITPKLFSRVTRFDKAFYMKVLHPTLDWMTIAIHCGYYDYQHLVKDYKDFTTHSPNAFHALEDKSPERALGLSEALYRYKLD